MKLKKENFNEEFFGYGKRYFLDEVIKEYNDHKVKTKGIIRTNDFNEILNKVKQIILKSNEKIEFIENKSIKIHKKSFKDVNKESEA